MFIQITIATLKCGVVFWTCFPSHVNHFFWLHSGVWRTFMSRLQRKLNSCPENFHCIEYILFIIQDFWATCACPEKTECATVLNIFLHSGFLSNLRLPCYFWLYWIQHTFYIQDFQQFAIALKFFTVLNITFNIQDLGATCACPEKRVCVENFRCIEYNFYI